MIFDLPILTNQYYETETRGADVLNRTPFSKNQGLNSSEDPDSSHFESRLGNVDVFFSSHFDIASPVKCILTSETGVRLDLKSYQEHAIAWARIFIFITPSPCILFLLALLQLLHRLQTPKYTKIEAAHQEIFHYGQYITGCVLFVVL